MIPICLVLVDYATDLVCRIYMIYQFNPLKLLLLLFAGKISNEPVHVMWLHDIFLLSLNINSVHDGIIVKKIWTILDSNNVNYLLRINVME